MFAIGIDDHNDIWIGKGGTHLLRRFQDGDGGTIVAESVVGGDGIRPFFYGNRRPAAMFRTAFQRDNADDSSFVSVWTAFNKMFNCGVQQPCRNGDAAIRVGIAVARDAEQPAFAAKMGACQCDAVRILDERDVGLPFLRRTRDA